MRYRLTILLCLVLPVGPVAIAQDASFLGASTAPLPLRNLAIEVRQSLANVSAGQNVGLNGAQAALSQRIANATSQVLVLNGHPARMRVATDAPLRLYQAVRIQRQWRLFAGNVRQGAETELWVTPRWTDSAELELELSTRQSQPLEKALSAVSSGASSTVVVPLDTWTTVAESDAATTQNQSTLTSAARRDTSTRSEVQVRVTVR